MSTPNWAQDLAGGDRIPVYVGFFAELLPLEYLWCHPKWSALGSLDAIEEFLATLLDLRQTKITNLDAVILIH